MDKQAERLATILGDLEIVSSSSGLQFNLAWLVYTWEEANNLLKEGKEYNKLLLMAVEQKLGIVRSHGDLNITNNRFVVKDNEILLGDVSLSELGDSNPEPSVQRLLKFFTGQI